VADPWSDDLAALGERTRSQLRSIAATRANLRMEPKMTFFKRRPVLATALAALVLAIAAPVAWAIGTRIFVSIDPDKSGPEIQQDVQHQLDTAGVKATVQADKTDDGQLRLQIRSSDPSLGSNLDIDVNGSVDVAGKREMRVEVETKQKLDDAAFARLHGALDSKAVKTVVEADDLDPEHVEEVVTDALVNAGFRSVHVDVDAHSITVHVTAPPTP
jgi:hypothetical protein